MGRPFRRIWSRGAIAGTAILLLAGVIADCPFPVRSPREPVLARHLRPLRDAPVPVDREVGLMVPDGLRDGDRERLLMETVWQRPEVRWRLTDASDPSAWGVRDLVIVGPGSQRPPVGPGWNRVWARGWIVVLRKGDR